MKERADRLLVERNLAESRQKAQALILAGMVYADDVKVEKSGQLLSVDRSLRVKESLPYVGRGGLKLEGALESFKLSVSGKTAADIGASTGGFTDCLLQRGASFVFAVDVDTRQLDWKLSRDSRIQKIQKNARYLTSGDFDRPLDIVVMDVSFISILKLLPVLRNLGEEITVVSLVKPQFEVGRGQVGKRGIVRDPSLHRSVLASIIEKAELMGYVVRDVVPSPIRGQKGNREFFIHWTMTGESLDSSTAQSLIKEAVRDDSD
ncbi:MAG: TlyA family RNA methyltransferase [Acidobacteriota bacterium]|nr:TlyA family RNA methyltransferase [Acidobacteriota bacterium]MBU4494769.1 TlyA family RNA methyltransferase [Acidobacteriota bacterium]MCG2816224.1 TlyA family RNA methyltransferase [Candidatus Aminicenantes bacterium]